MTANVRVLLGPHEIAGYYSSLYDGFRKIGVDVDFYSYRRHPFAYEHDGASTRIRRCIQWLMDILASRSSYFVRGLAAAALAPVVALYFVQALFKYDAFVLAFGESLLPRNVDLPILWILGKRTICVIAHGSEARPPYLSGKRYDSDDVVNLKKMRRRTRRRFKRVQRIHRWASVVVGAPYSSSHFARGTQVNHFALGIPQPDPAEVRRAGVLRKPEPTSDSINILHAPSNPRVKGTARIRRAIRELQNQGVAINYVELQGVSNSEVLAALQNTDFVVDQVFSDTPMAGFAAEAARHGVPTIVGGYALDALIEFIPKGMVPPSLVCHPDKLIEAIGELAHDPRRRASLGDAARSFVASQWNNVVVAQKYLQLIEGNIPVAWLFDPSDITYVQGTGQSEQQCQAAIRTYVDHFGSSALCLDHRPALKTEVLRFAATDPLAPAGESRLDPAG